MLQKERRDEEDEENTKEKKRESLGLHPQTSWVGNWGREVCIHRSHPLLVVVVVRPHSSSSNPARVFLSSLLCPLCRRSQDAFFVSQKEKNHARRRRRTAATGRGETKRKISCSRKRKLLSFFVQCSSFLGGFGLV
jgi:hypothetical protein